MCRGVLSTVNGLYDPLGFAAPVIIEGKALLRDLTADVCDWDTPLPSESVKQWVQWRNSLKELQHLQVSRPYIQASLQAAQRKELCVFSDASVKAIAAVAYLRILDAEGHYHSGFILRKSKACSSSRLLYSSSRALCSLLAADMAEFIISEMYIKLDTVTFFTDSEVVLGYFYNEKCRFHIFAHNRVQRIRICYGPQQWHYVSSEQNSADHATRSVSAGRLKDITWLTGPAFLTKSGSISLDTDTFDLVDARDDVEIRPQVSTLSTAAREVGLKSQRFEHFSSLKSLSWAVACLIHIACLFRKDRDQELDCSKTWHHCVKAYTVDALTQAKHVIIQAVQEETYAKEAQCIRNHEDISKDSPLHKINPIIDEKGLLRIGGCLSQAKIEDEEKNPSILSGRHHIMTLLIKHYHELSQHQG